MIALDLTLGSTIIAIVLIACYLVLIRPQNRRLQALRRMIAGLRPGDQIVSAGGLVGTVVGNADLDDVEVEIAKGIKVRIRRNLINEVSSPRPGKADLPGALRNSSRVIAFNRP